MGAVIAAVWVVVYAIAFVSVEPILPFTLGYDKGFTLVQLSSYSFIHFSLRHLTFDLIWLGGLINIGRKHLSLAGFIRVYSLGAIGGGLIRLSLLWLFGEEGYVVGANLPILTMLGAMTVLEQDRVSIFEDDPPKDPPELKVFSFMAWLFLIVVPALFGSNFIAWLLLNVLSDGLVFILALFRIRLMRIAVVWLLADLIIWLCWDFRPDVFLADVAALGLGMGYVLVERLGRKFEARAQTAS